MAAVLRSLRLTALTLLLASLSFGTTAPRAAWPAPRRLRGGWTFLPDVHEQFRAARLPVQGWRPVQVGLSIQAQFGDLRNFAGAGWYRRRLRLGPLPPGGRWLLAVGACDYRCVVYLNGRRVGAHSGGYTPFALDLTAAGHRGENRLLIRIADPPGPVADFRASYAQIPHGKQNWYVQTSGLWQAVRLEAKPAYYLQWAHVLTRGRRVWGVRLRLAHWSDIPPGARARVEVFGPVQDRRGGRTPRGGPTLSTEIPLAARKTVTLRLAMRGAWWSPRHPRLYRFVVALPDGDRWTGQFGLRTIAERNGRMYLNHWLFYMRGALDQAFYPRGVYSPPSLGFLEREMREARALGLNTLRLHIKVPDPRYLEAADRTGMLLWYEIPNWDRLTPLSERRAKATLRAEIARDWNHPSLILQSIINESWGANLKVAWQRKWLRGMYLWAKAHLPDRLVDDNTACCSNFHIQSDLADFHNYNSIPDHAAAWNRFVRAFARRPKWLYSPYGDAHPAGPAGPSPLVLSEFGNWGLPLLPAKKPWWFARGFNGNPITIPGGVSRRLWRSALGAQFRGYPALARATERHEWQALRYEIESLRRHASIQGYVITELTDVNWESNGLMTMWRRPKIFAAKLVALQRPVIVMAEADKPDYAAGTTAKLKLIVSNETPRRFTGGVVALGGRNWSVPALASGAVQAIAVARVRLSAPAHAGHAPWAAPRTVHFQLTQDGRPVDTRSLRLAVIAGLRGRGAVRLAAAQGPGWRTLARRLAAEGYRVLPAGARGGILITPSWPLPAGFPAGRRVLVLADRAGALTAGPERAVARSGNLSGDWISNFNWVNTRRGPFAFLRRFDPVLGREAGAITPRVLLTPPPRSYRNAESAGFFLGWVHAEHALAVAARAGQSRLFVTTFPLAGSYGRDPLATAMLNSIIRHMESTSFQPRWRWPAA